MLLLLNNFIQIFIQYKYLYKSKPINRCTHRIPILYGFNYIYKYNFHSIFYFMKAIIDVINFCMINYL